MKFLCSALLLFIASLQVVSAGADFTFCYKKLLNQRQDRSEQLVPSTKSLGFADFDGLPGSRHLFELLPGLKWHSRSHSPLLNDYQADPRSFLFAIEDEHTARYMGFGMPRENQLILPSARRLNLAMDAIEKRSQQSLQPLRFGFRWKRVSSVLDSEKYLRLFHAGFQPLIEGDAQHLHDYGYHVPSLLIPEADILRARKLAGNLLDFIALLKQKDSHLFKNPQFRNRIRILIEREAEKIDLGTGNAGIGLARGYFNSAYAKGASDLIRVGFSEESWLMANVESVFMYDIGVLLRLTQFLNERTKQDPEFSRVRTNDSTAWLRAVELRRRLWISLAHALMPR